MWTTKPWLRENEQHSTWFVSAQVCNVYIASLVHRINICILARWALLQQGGARNSYSNCYQSTHICGFFAVSDV